MLRARSQAERYARSLPADEGRPPFVVVADVGRSIELYAELSRSVATCTPFPDPRSHRIALDDAILVRRVALDAVRAAEESAGQVRWLRPSFQHPADAPAPAPRQELLPVDDAEDSTRAAPTVSRSPWPRDLAEQIRAVAGVLAEAPGTLTLDEIAARFTGRGPWKRRLPVLLDSLVAVGRARATEGGFVGTG